MAEGRVLSDRFEIERLAGRGGMGKVYRARDRETGQPVAVKVLQVDGAIEAERFAREAQVLARLTHPSIVRFVAHGRTPANEPFLAIEWLDGEDLGTRLRRAGLTVAESLVLGAKVAAGLEAAHRLGVVHRDVKPGNLWLCDGDPASPKILDFGIARLREAGERTLTQTGMMIGTPGYMAPEQARGEPVVDARADVFSLGCVLFKCLTGRLPFEGEDVTAVLLKLVLEDAPRLRELRPDAPVDLERLLDRMLAKSRSERPADAGEVARELATIEVTPSGQPGPASTGSLAITVTERPLMCIVLARLPLGSWNTGPGSLETAIDALGAQMAVLADGALLVTTPPGVFTDQAACAARAALAIHAQHPDAAVAVVAGRGQRARREAAGEVLDQAAALLREAGAGAVRVDDTVAGLVASSFELGGDATGLLLGEPRARVAPRTLLGKPTPFVGRERELVTLEASAAEVANDGVARAVLVTAAPGVGKSRLLQELCARLGCAEDEAPRARDGGFEVWRARGDAMRAGSPFGLLAPLLRRLAGVRDGEPLDVRRRKLVARLGRALPAEDRARVTTFLAELAGAPFPDDASVELRAARLDAILMGDQMRRAFEDLLAAECAAGPVLVAIDDAHWGDRPSLSFLDAALRNLAERPLLVVALARPELHEHFPGLWGGRPVTELTLAELSKKASEKLVREVLGPATPATTVARIVQLASGDAFYLEELMRAVAEGHGDVLPESVLAMVEQRLAGLDPRKRRVLRAASVFGNVFWAGGVAALLGGEDHTPGVDGALRDLCERELLDRRPVASFPGQEEYAFRQTLVREAAYAMLTDGDRRLGHRLAGEWLERSGESDPGAVAGHFERAGETERALSSLQRAAAQALKGNDLERALAWSERAIADLGDPSARAPGDPVLAALGALRLIRAEALRWSDDLAAAEASDAEAMRLLPRGSGPWLLAAGDRAVLAGRLGRDADADAIAADLLALLRDGRRGGDPAPELALAAARAATGLTLRGRIARADQLLAEVTRLEPTVAEPAALAQIDRAVSARAMVRGDLGVHLARTEAAVLHFTAAGDQRNACLARSTLAFGQAMVGRYEAAARALRDALATAERLGLPSVSAFARHALGQVLARLGALDEAIAVESQAVESFTLIGDQRLSGGARSYLAAIFSEVGDLDAAEREASLAIGALGAVPPVLAYTLAIRSDVRLRRGDAAGALADAEAANALLRDLGGIEEGEALVRLALAEALDAAGRHAEARHTLEEAKRRLLERAAKIGDEATRASFLEAVPENARTLALADRR